MAQQPDEWKRLTTLFKYSTLCWVDIWKGPKAKLGQNCFVKRVRITNGTALLDLSGDSSNVTCPNTLADAQVTMHSEIVRLHAAILVQNLSGLVVRALPEEKRLLIGEHCVVVT